VSDLLILGLKQGKVLPNSSQAKPDKPIAKDDTLSRLVIACRDKVEGHFGFWHKNAPRIDLTLPLVTVVG
jgi:hypothetical protein